jgi:VanZ family protein
VVLYMAAVFALSAQPRLPDVPGGLNDKQAHGITYGGLSVLAVRALAGGSLSAATPAAAAGGWAIATLYGVTDEWHQSFVDGRTADVMDFAADSAGAAVGAAALWSWGIILRLRRDRRRPARPS